MDFPEVPEHFLEESDFTMVTNVEDIGYSLKHEYKGQLLNSTSYKVYRSKNDEFKNWFSKNLFVLPSHQPIEFQKQQARFGTIGTHIVHSDIVRTFAVNYVFETGGDNVTTNWYKERGFPLYRTKSYGGKQADSGSVKYDDLECLDSVVLKKNRWYILDVRVLHDVQNIINCRKSLTISFMHPIHQFLGIK